MGQARVLPSHGAKSLKVAMGLLERLGFSARACLRGTGVDGAVLDSPDARVTLAQELVFYRNARSLTGDPLIGLRIGAEYHLPNYGIWGYAVMSAPNLGDALRLAFRFINLTYTCHAITLCGHGASAVMRLVPLRDFEDCAAVIADRDTSALFLIVSELLGRTLPLERVCFRTGSPRTRQPIRNTLAATSASAPPATSCESHRACSPTGYRTAIPIRRA